MKPADNIEKSIKKLRYKAGDEAHNRVLNNLFQALEMRKKQKQVVTEPSIWRTIMKSKITKLAAAAVIILIAAFGIILLDKAVTPTYALEQTIEANRGVRYVHLIKMYVDGIGVNATRRWQEQWFKLDENGELVGSAGKYEGQDDFNVGVWDWHNSISKLWLPGENKLTIKYAYPGTSQWPRSGEQMERDPTFFVKALSKLESEGKMHIEIEENEGEALRLTATRTHVRMEKWDELWRYPKYVLVIDPETKLVQQLEWYNKHGLRGANEYIEYADSMEPDIFELDPPADAEIIDLTIDIGLPQGDMTDEEAAIETVRQYIEAMIARDYNAAAKLYNGITASMLQTGIEEDEKKWLRLVDIGQPEIFTEYDWGPRVLMVPFEYQYEQGGVIGITGPQEAFKEGDPGPREHRKAMVRPVPCRPDRWVITGGI
jgi:hypothetical protein